MKNEQHFITEGNGAYISTFFQYDPFTEITLCDLLAGKMAGPKYQFPSIGTQATVQRYIHDEPNQYMGRKAALTKALAQTNLSKESRELIWKRFLEVNAIDVALLDIEKEIKRKEQKMDKQDLGAIVIALAETNKELLSLIARTASPEELRVIADTQDDLNTFIELVSDETL